jgi:hypothetical protein
MDKENKLVSLIDAILKKASPKFETSTEEQISNFIKSTLDGEKIISTYIGGTIYNKNSPTLGIYTLTKKSLIFFILNCNGDIYYEKVVHVDHCIIKDPITDTITERITLKLCDDRWYCYLIDSALEDMRIQEIRKFFNEVYKTLPEIRT